MAVPLAVSLVERAMPHGRGARATSPGQSEDNSDNCYRRTGPAKSRTCAVHLWVFQQAPRSVAPFWYVPILAAMGDGIPPWNNLQINALHPN